MSVDITLGEAYEIRNSIIFTGPRRGRHATQVITWEVVSTREVESYESECLYWASAFISHK